MSNEADLEQAIDMLTTMQHYNGAAVVSVTDGHVILIDKAVLQSALDNNKDADKIILFIKNAPKA